MSPLLTPPSSPLPTPSSPSSLLLNSLLQFYQQERDWVYYSRAALHLPPISHSIPPPSKSHEPPIKIEDDQPPITDHPPHRQSSRWLKRKQRFNLRLDRLSNDSRKRAPRHDRSDPSTRLLDLFSDLLDARAESCRRVSRLVRDSNRSMLHNL